MGFIVILSSKGNRFSVIRSPRMKGLTPLIFMTAVKPEAPMEIPHPVSDFGESL
jgi:hypothetical protein